MATNPNTHTQAPGAPPPFPPFQKETFASQLFWLALAFVVLYVLMSKVALPRVGGILADRKARIAADLAEAERARAESEAAAARHEKALADARANAQSIANETRDKLMGESEGQRKALETKLNAQLADAERSIATTKSAAMSNVRAVAVDAASAIVERLLGQSPPQDAIGSAVDRALKR